MECLPPTVMNNHVTWFYLLTHLGVNNIWATGGAQQKLVRQMHYWCGQTAAKKECGYFEQRTSSKKAVQLWQWLAWTTTERCTLLLLNFLNVRDLFGVWSKLKESIFKNNNQINFTVTTRIGVFSKEWTRAFASTRLVSEWKNGLRLLKCSMFRCWMLFFRMHGCFITLTRMKSMSLYLP